ncbi:putative aspartic peptidase A1 family [Rosa chinensis]|uniref:Putative aspartic peptidase A1 family n=1 Tax=Rosa chinensis TaxID=74649 RepID=A0A2P6R9P1_ROSCH|nr:putative aspartic peptidase A1 family [Rosa chinensis]
MRLYYDLLTNGYYTTRLWIGTPPEMFALIVDTGSRELRSPDWDTATSNLAAAAEKPLPIPAAAYLMCTQTRPWT